MSSTLKTLLAGVLIIILGAGVYFLLQSPNELDSNSNNTSQNESDDTTAEVEETLEEENTVEEADEDDSVPAATITYTDDGFDPSTTTVSAGSTIKIVNNSSDELEFSSDDHPEHTDNEELNTNVLDPGESTAITLKTAGTWGIHDHLDSSKTATVIVN